MDGRVRIETPESVYIIFETAGIGTRFTANLIDAIIQFALLLVVIISGFAGGISFYEVFDNVSSWYIAVLLITGFIILMGYYIFFEIVNNGRTPGKAIMKIRVIKSNGQPVSFISSVLRNIFRLADFFPSFYGLGILTMIMNPESRRIGDYIGGTIVVKEYSQAMPVTVEQVLRTGEESSEEVGLNIYPIHRDEYKLLKDFFERFNELLPDKRTEIGSKLAYCYWDRFHIPIEQRNEPIEFLKTVLRANAY